MMTGTLLLLLEIRASPRSNWVMLRISGPGDFQDISDVFSLVRLQVQDNLCLGLLSEWIFRSGHPPARRNRTGLSLQLRLHHSRG